MEELLAASAPAPAAAAAYTEPTPMFSEPPPAFSALDADLPPLSGFEPAPYRQEEPPTQELTAEPAWQLLLQAEPETPAFAAPSVEPYDREPSFALEAEPSFTLQPEPEPASRTERPGEHLCPAGRGRERSRRAVARRAQRSVRHPLRQRPRSRLSRPGSVGFSWSDPAPAVEEEAPAASQPWELPALETAPPPSLSRD